MSAKKSYSKTSLPTYEYMSPIWVRTACPVPQVKKRTKYAYHATIRLGVSAHRITVNRPSKRVKWGPRLESAIHSPLLLAIEYWKKRERRRVEPRVWRIGHRRARRRRAGLCQTQMVNTACGRTTTTTTGAGGLVWLVLPL